MGPAPRGRSSPAPLDGALRSLLKRTVDNVPLGRAVDNTLPDRGKSTGRVDSPRDSHRRRKRHDRALMCPRTHQATKMGDLAIKVVHHSGSLDELRRHIAACGGFTPRPHHGCPYAPRQRQRTSSRRTTPGDAAPGPRISPRSQQIRQTTSNSSASPAKSKCTGTPPIRRRASSAMSMHPPSAAGIHRVQQVDLDLSCKEVLRPAHAIAAQVV